MFDNYTVSFTVFRVGAKLTGTHLTLFTAFYLVYEISYSSFYVPETFLLFFSFVV